MQCVKKYKYQAYLITVATDAHEEVIWFDISVNEVLGVYIFNSADHLRTQNDNSQTFSQTTFKLT